MELNINPEVVACCTDVEYMRRCVEESKKLGIPFQILLCSTNRPEPVLNETRLGQAGRVLGFDIAYSGGSYYSCVLNDVVSGRLCDLQAHGGRGVTVREEILAKAKEVQNIFMIYLAKREGK